VVSALADFDNRHGWHLQAARSRIEKIEIAIELRLFGAAFQSANGQNRYLHSDRPI
jgi:hypothetical protein